jgi:hypothetical protein
MKPKENMEKFVRARKPHVKTSRQMDKRTLNDSFEAMEQTIRTKSADHKLSEHRIIITRRIIKIAAAAVIIAGIGLLVHFRPWAKVHTTIVTEVAKSPVELVTAMSLERAFQRGGLEAVEEQCRKAFKPLPLSPAGMSFEKIIEEFNGNGKGRERMKL